MCFALPVSTESLRLGLALNLGANSMSLLWLELQSYCRGCQNSASTNKYRWFESSLVAECPFKTKMTLMTDVDDNHDRHGAHDNYDEDDFVDDVRYDEMAETTMTMKTTSI